MKSKIGKESFSQLELSNPALRELQKHDDDRKGLIRLNFTFKPVHYAKYLKCVLYVSKRR
jgi:hypothetical protein